MRQNVFNRIRRFVNEHPNPTILELLNENDQRYELISALAEALIGQDLAVNTKTSGVVELFSLDGTSVLQIEVNGAKKGAAKGLIANDLKEFLGAIRVHEVESYDLVMLPPGMRTSSLELLCNKIGITQDKLRRFINLWVSQNEY